MAKQKNRSATLLFLAIIGLAFAGYVIINGGLTGPRAPVVEDTVVRLNPDNPRQLLVTLIGTRFSPVPMENMVAFGERKFHPVKSGRNFLTIALPVSADLVGGGRLHGLLAFGLIVSIPFTKAFHLISSPANLLLRDEAPPGRLPVAMESGVRTVRDFTWRQLLQVDACTWCGKCQEVCPANQSGFPLSVSMAMSVRT